MKRVESSWNVMAHGDVREGKWRGNWRMEWVASTLHATLEHGVVSITTADAHTSAASSRLNWRPPPIEMDSSVSPKDEIWFLRMRHHISNAVYISSSSYLVRQLEFQLHSKQFWITNQPNGNWPGLPLQRIKCTAATVDFGASGWVSALQTGRSRVRFQILSLEFFIDITLPAALCPWGPLNF